jgi:hypothetical protein
MINSSLSAQLASSGKAASIHKILRHGGYAFAFRALLAGTATISWYQVAKGAHTAAAGTLLVATGSQTFTGAGTSTLTIRLTRKGRKLLKHAERAQVKRLTLISKGKFAPIGAGAVSTERTFKLRI